MKKKANAGVALGLSGLGALIGAFSTLKATGDDPEKSKKGLLKLLIRNTSLGALTGAGAYGTIAGIQGIANAYKSSDLPGTNTANAALVETASYKLSDNMRKAIRATLRTKKAENKSRLSPVTVGIGSAGLAALLTYINAEKDKANLYNVAGNAGLTGLLAALGYGAYQAATPSTKTGSLQKSASDEDNSFFSLDNPAISWGLPSAATLGLLSYLTQDEKKKDINKVIKHALTGGLLGTGAGMLHSVMYNKKQPEKVTTTAAAEPTLTPPSRADLEQAEATKKLDTWGSLFLTWPRTAYEYGRSSSLNKEKDRLQALNNMSPETQFKHNLKQVVNNNSSPYFHSNKVPNVNASFKKQKEIINMVYPLKDALEKEYNTRAYVQQINATRDATIRDNMITAMCNRLNQIPGVHVSRDQVLELITKYSPTVNRAGFTPEAAQRDLQLANSAIAALQAGKALTPEQRSLLDYYYNKK